MGDLNEYCKHGDVEAYCADCWIELKRQRDELLAAARDGLEALIQVRDANIPYLHLKPDYHQTVDALTAAIAKVKP